jgi:hypothetical protein
MSARTVAVAVGSGHGTDRQSAEVSVVDGHIWMTFLGPRGGRQYTLPLAPQGASDLGGLLRAAAGAVGYDHDKSAVPLHEDRLLVNRDKPCADDPRCCAFLGHPGEHLYADRAE